MTFFFEPLQVSSLNNEINVLTGEEKEKNTEFWQACLTRPGKKGQNLWNDFEVLGELDLLFAMGKALPPV